MTTEQMLDADILSGNGMELLLFYLGDKCFGIDITRVKEVIPRPEMTQVPHSHPAVCGVMHLRGAALTVIDLQQAIGNGDSGNGGESVIVTELADGRQGFLVSQVERIVHCAAGDFSHAPSGIGDDNYIEKVSRHQDGLIQLLDFNKILATVLPDQVSAYAVA